MNGVQCPVSRVPTLEVRSGEWAVWRSVEVSISLWNFQNILRSLTILTNVHKHNFLNWCQNWTVGTKFSQETHFVNKYLHLMTIKENDSCSATTVYYFSTWEFYISTDFYISRWSYTAPHQGPEAEDHLPDRGHRAARRQFLETILNQHGRYSPSAATS